MNVITWYIVVMVLLDNILCTIATPKVDLHESDNQEIPQKRKLHKHLDLFLNQLQRNKFNFVDISQKISDVPNLSFNAIGTSSDKLSYGVIYDIEKLRPSLEFHAIEPIGVNQKRPLRSGCWFKEKFQLLDFNGNPLKEEKRAKNWDFKQIHQTSIPGFQHGIYYYCRSHSAACGDFKDKKEQKATFSMLNATPMSQSLNNGDWKMMENYCRRYSDTYQTKLIAITSCSGDILDYSKVPPKPFKLNGRVTVPKWFGKVIIDTHTHECIMFTAENDIRGGHVYVWFDLNHKEIKQMFPELHKYVVLKCNPLAVKDRMKQAILKTKFAILG